MRSSAVSNVQWSIDYLVFAQEGVLVAQRFDQASERIVGARYRLPTG
jgi:hypothetical protein